MATKTKPKPKASEKKKKRKTTTGHFGTERAHMYTQPVYVIYNLDDSDEIGIYTSYDLAKEDLEQSSLSIESQCIFEIPLNTLLKDGMIGGHERCSQCSINHMRGEDHSCPSPPGHIL